MSLISCKNLSVSYDKNQALHGVNFDVQRGDYLCIVGENGSGKSTLVKALVGLIGTDKGQITYARDFQKNKIGYLAQTKHIQKDFPACVYEIVRSGRLNQKKHLPFYTKKDDEETRRALEYFKINDIAKSSFAELSGGQQQRVLLARAFLSAGEILFLDEPVTGLDPIVSSQLYEIISSLNHNLSLTVVMVSHDVAQAVRYANKILHIENNTVGFFGSTQDYLSSDMSAAFTQGNTNA